jgi:hypothetical protein
VHPTAGARRGRVRMGRLRRHCSRPRRLCPVMGARHQVRLPRPHLWLAHGVSGCATSAAGLRIVVNVLSDAPWLGRFFLKHFLNRLENPTTLAGRSFVADGTGKLLDHAEGLFNGGQGLAVEIQAGNGTATARARAGLYAMLVLGGELDGVRILSPEVVALFARQQIERRDFILEQASPRLLRQVLAPPVRRTLGYLMNPKFPRAPATFGPNPFGLWSRWRRRPDQLLRPREWHLGRLRAQRPHLVVAALDEAHPCALRVRRTSAQVGRFSGLTRPGSDIDKAAALCSAYARRTEQLFHRFCNPMGALWP